MDHVTIAERGYANSLTERRPAVSADRLIAELVPPPRFAHARFAGYLPDPAEPSQTAARDLLAERARAWSGTAAGKPARRGLLRRSSAGSAGGRGVYLDGGYGVGKTHLLASLWHETEGPKVYGTFVEYTNLVGALGFGPTVAHLATQHLVCIDEFELDDPGDTVLVSTLLTRLAEAGVQLAATSNTLPGQLGEGRFAADDFMREIQGLAARFTAVRIEGKDYRRRDGAAAPEPLADAVVRGTPSSRRAWYSSASPARAPRARTPPAAASSTASTNWSGISAPCTRAATARCSTASSPSACSRCGRSRTRTPRCASSCSSTGSTTGPSRCSPPVPRPTGCSPPICWPAGTGRSTCAPSAGWSR
jgi:predicted ATPase